MSTAHTGTDAADPRPADLPAAVARSASRYRALAIAASAAILVYFLASSIEIAIIERLRPGELELTWISDGVLAVAFGVAVFLWLRLKWTRSTLSRLEREHIVIDAQLSLAAEIQRGLLPPVPPAVEGMRWAAQLVQAGQIGGDLYDFIRIDRRAWLVLVADVSGKGVPAALVLASVRTMFRMMTHETSDPGELVTRMANRLFEDHGGSPYLTCLVLRVDLDARQLAFVNAGHPTGVVLHGSPQDADPVLLASCGPPAGLLPGSKYKTVSMAAPAAAIGILVTDGITEAFDVMGVTGPDPVATLLAQLPRPVTPDRICTELIERTRPALSSGDWHDDRTVVSFAWGG